MKIEQKTITTIKADEGKLLVRKSDGWVAGDSVTLGYNYYEAGIALSNPHFEVPEDYEEIEKPEDYEVKPVIDHVKRLKRTNELLKKNISEMNELNLSAVDALEVVEWYPKWGIDVKEGDEVKKGFKFTFNGKLFSVLQDHTILPHYEPSINTAALYVEVTPDYNESGEEMGTIENPIPYEGNMVLENGKYYSQEGIIYLCTRNSEIALYNSLRDLIGLYVDEYNVKSEEEPLPEISEENTQDQEPEISMPEEELPIPETGSQENPILYESGLVLENGKYYSQDNVVYLCNRDSGNPVYHALKDLVGLYVNIVE